MEAWEEATRERARRGAAFDCVGWIGTAEQRAPRPHDAARCAKSRGEGCGS